MVRGSLTCAPFIKKLHTIVSTLRFQHIISHCNEEDPGIIIYDKDLLVRYVIPEFFNHGSYRSFTRQLSAYNFKRNMSHKSATKSQMFSNKYFIRDRQDLLPRIVRVGPSESKNENSTRSVQSDSKNEDHDSVIHNDNEFIASPPSSAPPLSSPFSSSNQAKIQYDVIDHLLQDRVQEDIPSSSSSSPSSEIITQETSSHKRKLETYEENDASHVLASPEPSSTRKFSLLLAAAGMSDGRSVDSSDLSPKLKPTKFTTHSFGMDFVSPFSSGSSSNNCRFSYYKRGKFSEPLEDKATAIKMSILGPFANGFRHPRAELLPSLLYKDSASNQNISQNIPSYQPSIRKIKQHQLFCSPVIDKEMRNSLKSSPP